MALLTQRLVVVRLLCLCSVSGGENTGHSHASHRPLSSGTPEERDKHGKSTPSSTPVSLRSPSNGPHAAATHPKLASEGC